MNKNESKYQNTATRMDEALIELLDEKELADISIKELCKKAGVNRSTFYLHYDNLNDLLSETLDYINKIFVSVYKEKSPDFIAKISTAPLEELDLVKSAYLTPYLNFVKDHQIIFRASFNNTINMKARDHYESLEKYVFDPILERYHAPEAEKKYIMAYYISGTTAVIREWVAASCADDVDFIENLIIGLIKRSN